MRIYYFTLYMLLYIIYAYSQPAGISGNNTNQTASKISIALFFVESNGSIDADLYSWSLEDENRTIDQITGAIDFWKDESLKYNKTISFNLLPYRSSDVRCKQGYEPITHTISFYEKWANLILKNFGYTSTNFTTNLTNFNSDLKSSAGSDYAFSVFICYNPEPAQAYFTGGKTFLANTSHTLILFRNNILPVDSNANLFAYTVGLNLGALQECAPGSSDGNPNHETNSDGSVNTKSVDCIMKSRKMFSGLCSYSANQLGWIPSPNLLTITSNFPFIPFRISTSHTSTGTAENSIPSSFGFEPGLTVNINPSVSLTYKDTLYSFLNWSDGGNINHDIIINNRSDILTVNYAKITAPLAPVLLTPANNSICIPENSKLIWKKVYNAEGYNVQIDTNIKFTSPATLNLADTNWLISGLTAGIKYYWRVRGINSIGNGAWSGVYDFTTKIYPPEPVSPVNDAKDISVNAEFIWNSGSGALDYFIQISEDENFSEILKEEITTQTVYRISAPLIKNSIYYWRVKSRNRYCESGYSETRKFQTEITSAFISTPSLSCVFDSTAYLSDDLVKNIEIMNLSSVDDLKISSCHFENGSPFFQITSKTSFTIKGNAKNILTVKFKPHSVGEFYDYLILKNSSKNEPSLRIFLSAKVYGSMISISVDTINYGDIGINSGSREKYITINNSGNCAVKLFPVSIESPFFEVSSVMPSSGEIIYPGQKFNLRIKIIPLRIGTINIVIPLKTNSQNHPDINLCLLANIKEPNLIIPEKLFFDSTGILFPFVIKPLILRNNSSNEIEIYNQYLEGDTGSFKMISAPLLLLKPNCSDSMIIEFFPRTYGNKNGILNVLCSDSLFPNRKIEIEGFASGASKLRCDIDNIIYDTLAAGKFQDRNILIKNEGNLNLSIAKISLCGKDSADFQIIRTITYAIENNHTDTITLRALGNQPSGKKEASLEIYDDHNNKFLVQLSSYIISPSIIKSCAFINFDTIDVTNSRQKYFILKNNGNAKLLISNIIIDGPFSGCFLPDNHSFPIAIGPKDSIEFNITYKPTKAGYHYARILIICNDPCKPEESVVISGYGKSCPKIFLTQTKIVFDNTAKGKSSDKSLRIKNCGGSELTIDTVFIRGQQSKYFAISTHRRTLSVNDSLELTIRFSPFADDTNKNYYSEMIIRCNDSSCPVIELSGKIHQEDVVISDTLIDFNDVMLFDSLLKSLSIINNRPEIIKIDSIFIDPIPNQPFIILNAPVSIYIDPFSSCQIKIIFTPKTKNRYQTYLNLSSDYLMNMRSKIRLTGNTIYPNIRVDTENIFIKTNVDSIRIKDLKIANTGNADLAITGINISGKDSVDFYVSKHAFPIIIQPGKFFIITVSFKPQKEGIKNANLNIYSNDLINDGVIHLTGEAGNYKSGVNGDNDLSEFVLFQNHPNPFNPETQIKFRLPKAEHVILRIFDILGRDVTALIDERRARGEYTVIWYPKNIPSGVYYYQLRTEKISEIKKMLYLR